MIHVSVLQNWKMGWTVTIPPSCDICSQWARLKKSGVWVTNALSQNHKNQRLAISASLLARHRLTREEHRPSLSCIVNGSRNGWVGTKSNSPYKDLRASTKDNVMHLVEQRGCAVLRIASPRCNYNCWNLLPTTETSCTRNPRKTTNKTACSDATLR